MSKHTQASQPVMKIVVEPEGHERREHRRHDLEHRDLPVERWDGARRETRSFGRIVDLSAGGLRIRTSQKTIRPDQQIRVRLSLPEYAGICPFIQTESGVAEGRREWTGWMAVTRVIPIDDNQFDVAGRLVDMDDMDRGMLSLYLSTQPMAA